VSERAVVEHSVCFVGNWRVEREAHFTRTGYQRAKVEGILSHCEALSRHARSSHRLASCVSRSAYSADCVFDE